MHKPVIQPMRRLRNLFRYSSRRRRAQHRHLRNRGGSAPWGNDDHGALAVVGRRRLQRVAARLAAVIRIEAIWLATEPLDMRAGTETILARVVKVFGSARPHHAYLFANKNSTRMKVLVYDGLGIWLAARRLNKGRFVWTNGDLMIATALNPEQLQALVMGLPWSTLAHDHAITVM
ncbi:IS66 family insertion sequence element accessory protein TnpB [Burkholderia sp. MSMB1552]|uniref:IS66 family insertion sequence element accessory protein TnpB n=1 Tax=unclassified Burkholderia TaxID=2613784 RepID=UPI002F3E53B9